MSHGPACACAYTTDEALFNDLQLAKTSPVANNHCALQIAGARGWPASVQWLLADGRADPNSDDNFALKWACFFGHVEVVRMLLVDKRVCLDGYIFRLPCYQQHVDVVRVLLADGRLQLQRWKSSKMARVCVCATAWFAGAA